MPKTHSRVSVVRHDGGVMQVFTRRDDRGLYHIEFGHAGMHLVLHDVEDLRRLIGGLVALAESDDSSF